MILNICFSVVDQNLFSVNLFHSRLAHPLSSSTRCRHQCDRDADPGTDHKINSTSPPTTPRWRRPCADAWRASAPSIACASPTVCALQTTATRFASHLVRAVDLSLAVLAINLGPLPTRALSCHVTNACPCITCATDEPRTAAGDSCGSAPTHRRRQRAPTSSSAVSAAALLGVGSSRANALNDATSRSQWPPPRHIPLAIAAASSSDKVSASALSLVCARRFNDTPTRTQAPRAPGEKCVGSTRRRRRWRQSAFESTCAESARSAAC